MQKILAIALLLFCSSISNAQKSEYDYNIKQNSFEKHASDLSVKLSPFFLDLSNNNTAVGYSPEVNLRFSNIIGVNFQYLGSYSNRQPKVIKSDAPPAYNGVPNDFKNYNYYNGGVTLYLWSQTFEGQSKFRIPKSKRKEHSFLTVDRVEKAQQFALRLSAGQFQNLLKEKSNELDGTNADTLINYMDNEDGENFTTVNYNLYSGGFMYERINHLKVKIKEDSIGTKGRYNQWRIYADFLYARNMNLGDILYTWDDGGGRNEAVYDLNKYSEVQEYGCRVGFELNHTGRYGYFYGVEFGARPGTGDILSRYYGQIKVGFSLNYKLFKY